MNLVTIRPRPDLVDLPNISFVLAEELMRIGVTSVEELKRASAESIWVRLRAAGFVHGTHTLLALEGAIHGVPWQSVPPPRRQELLRFTHRADLLGAYR